MFLQNVVALNNHQNTRITIDCSIRSQRDRFGSNIYPLNEAAENIVISISVKQFH